MFPSSSSTFSSFRCEGRVTMTLLLVVAAAALSPAAAFGFRPVVSPSIGSRVGSAARSMPPLGAKSRSMPDIVETDEDGVEVSRIRVKNIERDWVWNAGQEDEYRADGELSVDLFLPTDTKPTGVVFFMHGFSQYPRAYRETLQYCAEQTGAAVVAVETGLTSKIVLEGVAEKPLSFITDPSWPQFVLQRAVSQDTLQCIRMIADAKEDAFEEYDLPRKGPFGVAGHSMGGGLSFPVAVDANIDYVFTMAAAAGVEEFDPVQAASKGTIDHSMLLAGTWDLIARANKVEAISAALNQARPTPSSIFVLIQRGIHTGFEDRLVLFNFPLNVLGAVLAIALNVLTFLEVVIVFPILSALRRNTGQLEGSKLLMAYFFEKMVQNKGVNPTDAAAYLDQTVTEPWDDKFDMTYGGESNK